MPTVTTDSLLSHWTPASVGLLIFLITNLLPTFVSRMVKAFKGQDVSPPADMSTINAWLAAQSQAINAVASSMLPPALAGQLLVAHQQQQQHAAPLLAFAPPAPAPKVPPVKTGIAAADTVAGIRVPNIS